MTPDRHAHIKEVFLGACEIEKDRRQAWLEQACGNDIELKHEVEQLLAHHKETSSMPDEAQVPAVPPGNIPPTGWSTEFWDQPKRQSRNFPPGKRLAARYRIVCLLGQGGMGEVYRAEDLVLGQNVALKFLPTLLAKDPRWLERMRQEVRMARRVTHPHVCRVYDLCRFHEDLSISMEYVDGEDLRALLVRIGRPPYEKALQLSREICSGLAAAHAQGILHRDLKPANIMIDGLGHARITDFGLAAVHDRIQQAEIRAGTPDYMAPEQLTGCEVTFKSDIYALGVTLYQLLTGEPAALARTVTEHARHEHDMPPQLPGKFADQIDPEVQRTIVRCLEPDPRDRPESVTAVMASLPGGVFTAAAQAGETLPPELVAAGDELEKIDVASSRRYLMLFFIMLAALIPLSAFTHPVQRLRLDRSPEVLAAIARHVTLKLGLPPPHMDVYGLDMLSLSQSHRLRTESTLHSLAVPRVNGNAIIFWYRSSMGHLIPSDPIQLVFGEARVSARDPPEVQPGDCRIILEPGGKLLSFETHKMLGPSARFEGQADWLPFMNLAGLEMGRLHSTEPQIQLSLLPADAQQAWIGTFPNSAIPIRVEAATYRGHPVFFSVLYNARVPAGVTGFGGVVWREWLMKASRAVMITIMAALSIPLARKNLRSGRSDQKGALRLAIFVIVLNIVAWLLEASHVHSIGTEWRLMILMLAGAVAQSCLVWLLYVALEPYARRFWPKSLVSWSRVLQSRILDPLVGRDVLAGCVLGALLALIFRLDQALGSIGLPGSRDPAYLEDFLYALVGTRITLAFYCYALFNAIQMALAFMLLLGLLRYYLKNATVAGVLAVLLICPRFIPRGSHEWLSLLIIGVGVVIVTLWAFTQLGLVSVVVGFFVASLLNRSPLTLNAQAWYTDLSLMTLVHTSLLALGAFWLVRRGRSPSAVLQ